MNNLLHKEPFNKVAWKTTIATVNNKKHPEKSFSRQVAFPDFYSQTAINIIASKYFTPDETNLAQLITRIVNTNVMWGLQQGFFEDTNDDFIKTVNEYIYSYAIDLFDDNGDTYKHWISLADAILMQEFWFNSPVQFNIGNPYRGRKQQVAACYIVGIDDNMESIEESQKIETEIFRFGAGKGSNRGKLRSSKERIKGGGYSSGPNSFAKVTDAIAKVTKSGGISRRAAVMESQNDDHLDILEFIWQKNKEEQKAKALIAAGYSSDFDDPNGAYGTVNFQNSNQSVLVSNELIDAVRNDKHWTLKGVADKSVTEVIKAKDLWDNIAQCAWECADPGLLFKGTIQEYNVAADLDEIRSSNPCFVGDAIIDTAEGRITIEELYHKSRKAEKLPMVFSFNFETGLPELNQILGVYHTKNTNQFIKVTTDKGLELPLCTPEHIFYLYDGTEVQAQDLKSGMSLRKIARGTNTSRDNRRIIYTKDNDSGEYQSRWMWAQMHGIIPEGMHVHHKDGDPTNDRISNLALLPSSEHLSNDSAGTNNANAYDLNLQLLYTALEELKNTGEITITRYNSLINKKYKGLLPLANWHRGVQGKSFNTFVANAYQEIENDNDKVKDIVLVTLEQSVPVYDISVNKVHNFAICDSMDTSKHSIIVHNCGEYLYLDNTSCNLGSLNLLKILIGDTSRYNEDKSLNFIKFLSRIRTATTALSIWVQKASYPHETIANGTKQHNTIGLGFGNLGALLMYLGLEYGSEEAQKITSRITAFMHFYALQQSAEIAAKVGPFPAYDTIKNSMLKVINRQLDDMKSLDVLDTETFKSEINSDTFSGFYNAQVTVIAPMGTIGIAMDCDTTGCEPLVAPTSFKQVVNGDLIEFTPDCYKFAKSTYGKEFKTALGNNVLTPHDHINMMAAMQPFLSGGISKTINCPSNTTVQEIKDLYMYAFDKRLKGIAIYRDGCKASQPVTTTNPNEKKEAVFVGKKHKMPRRRKSETFKFEFGGHSGFLKVGYYPDGSIGEIFADIAKEGSTISGLLDSWAIAVSMAIQYGAPVEEIIEKFKNSRFEPAGFVYQPEFENMRTVTSVVDFAARTLENLLLEKASTGSQEPKIAIKAEATGEVCTACNSSNTKKTGNCYTCQDCFETGGCG